MKMALFFPVVLSLSSPAFGQSYYSAPLTGAEGSSEVVLSNSSKMFVGLATRGHVRVFGFLRDMAGGELIGAMSGKIYIERSKAIDGSDRTTILWLRCFDRIQKGVVSQVSLASQLSINGITSHEAPTGAVDLHGSPNAGLQSAITFMCKK